MKKIILQQALDELTDAIAYYEEQQAGLGMKFKDEVNDHVQWILNNYSIPRIRSGGYQRVNLKVFPFYIAYMVRQDTLWILAIAHGHRKPGYWIGRKSDMG